MVKILSDLQPSDVRNASGTSDSDGSVELTQKWLPGGAQGHWQHELLDGEQYLLAIRLAGDVWEFHAVIAKCDPELGCSFDTTNGEPWDDWSWGDVEWFVPCVDLELPYNPEVKS